jgi:hypothetical protein
MPSNINIKNQIIDSRIPCLLEPVIMKNLKSQAMLYLKIVNKYSY